MNLAEVDDGTSQAPIGYGLCVGRRNPGGYCERSGVICPADIR